jgi:hypothetical protein
MTTEAQTEPVEGLVAIERIILFHESYGREGDGSEETLVKARNALAALKSAIPASAEVEATCELLTKRDGQEFDGEVHLNSEEAACIRRLLRSLSTRLAAVEAENFKLAAGQCIVEGGLVGDDHGHSACTLEAERDKAVEHLTGLLWCFNERGLHVSGAAGGHPDQLGAVLDAPAFLARKDAEQ